MAVSGAVRPSKTAVTVTKVLDALTIERGGRYVLVSYYYSVFRHFQQYLQSGHSALREAEK
jgi:hypothetical protein